MHQMTQTGTTQSNQEMTAALMQPRRVGSV